MMTSILVSWLGRTDLRAAQGDAGAGIGPIAQALLAGRYLSVHLICDFPPRDAKLYVNWLSQRTQSPVHLHPVKLRSPTHFADIYTSALGVLNGLRSEVGGMTYHLSPGTPAMQSIWILLAKTTHPARLIQSSQEAGVEDANIPFDISAEFIPQLLAQSDRRMTELAQGNSIGEAEFADIFHRSAVMRNAIGQAKRVAIRSIPVLIEGESGTGKELLARAIHQASTRSRSPFVTVNCGAIPLELVESEFFGHTKGAFTGAAERRGHFENANGGTLFLDEIGELPKAIQVKLLRALQEGEVTPIGQSSPRKVNVRIIAATNRTMVDEVVAGNFREDLFYRLAVAIIRLPPLRERTGDIGLLIDRLLEKVNLDGDELGLSRKKLSTAARNFMLQHAWPGNIRELFNTLHRATVWAEDEVIDLEAMKGAILKLPSDRNTKTDVLNRTVEGGVHLEALMAEVARHYLTRTMKHTANNKTKAAELLHLGSYQTLSNWLDKYGVSM